MTTTNTLREDVYILMSQLPDGMVTTYGDIAAMTGHPNAARVIGGISHYGPDELPWHRLVNRFGGLAMGFPGGREIQQQLLEGEGIRCTDFVIDNFKELRWQPTNL